MKASSVLVLLAVAICLLMAAGLTQSLRLWSSTANHTVPWFLGALAVALLLVTLTAALTGCAPGEIPVGRVLIVWIGTAAVFGGGLVVDARAFDHEMPRDWSASLGEWIGFTLMLAVLFWVPRLGKSRRPDGGDGSQA